MPLYALNQPNEPLFTDLLPASSVSICPVVFVNKPEKVIAKYVREHSVDLVMMGTVSRS